MGLSDRVEAFARSSKIVNVLGTELGHDRAISALYCRPGYGVAQLVVVMYNSLLITGLCVCGIYLFYRILWWAHLANEVYQPDHEKVLARIKYEKAEKPSFASLHDEYVTVLKERKERKRRIVKRFQEVENRWWIITELVAFILTVALTPAI